MQDEGPNIQKKLRLGIEAARAGQKNIAQVHLNAVLQLDPNNVPALLWLAYVSPSTQDSIRLLEQVLALDPNNERAKSGLRWAQARLGQVTDELTPVERQPTPTETTSTPAESQTQSTPLTKTQPMVPAKTQTTAADPAEEESLRKKLLADDVQKKQAKKGVLAHRARRTIDPIATILLVLGTLLGLVALGLVALIFVPTDTLAAWLPVSQPDPRPIISGETSQAIVETPSPTLLMSSLANDGDTIFVDVSHLIDLEATEPDPPAPPPGADAAANPSPSTETAVPLILPETNLVPFEPLRLIGPERLPTKPEVPQAETPPEVPQAVDNLLLAHQPAYPGEKWIEVDVTSQQVTAWEGNVPVFTFAASTGLQYTPTVLGEFHIYWKLESTLMTGPGYYLPGVPYTMYFYKGYALHGTYWHENFGQPMSHGCVNLETGNAKKLFEWAGPVIPPDQTQVTATADNPGTLVVVHE